MRCVAPLHCTQGQGTRVCVCTPVRCCAAVITAKLLHTSQTSARTILRWMRDGCCGTRVRGSAQHRTTNTRPIREVSAGAHLTVTRIRPRIALAGIEEVQGREVAALRCAAQTGGIAARQQAALVLLCLRAVACNRMVSSSQAGSPSRLVVSRAARARRFRQASCDPFRAEVVSLCTPIRMHPHTADPATRFAPAPPPPPSVLQLATERDRQETLTTGSGRIGAAEQRRLQREEQQLRSRGGGHRGWEEERGVSRRDTTRHEAHEKGGESEHNRGQSADESRRSSRQRIDACALSQVFRSNQKQAGHRNKTNT